MPGPITPATSSARSAARVRYRLWPWPRESRQSLTAYGALGVLIPRRWHRRRTLAGLPLRMSVPTRTRLGRHICFGGTAPTPARCSAGWSEVRPGQARSLPSSTWLEAYSCLHWTIELGVLQKSYRRCLPLLPPMQCDCSECRRNRSQLRHALS